MNDELSAIAWMDLILALKDLHAPLHRRTSAALAFVGLANETMVPGISVHSSSQPSS